jgi:hypothetical protein
LARSNDTVKAILLAGLAAGILDITAACVIFGLRGASPLEVFQSVASGLLGSETYKGGWATALLGGLLHFFIATVAAAVYHSASRALRFLVRRPAISGLLYGVAVYLFMNLVVLPLSAVPKHPFVLDRALMMVVVHMLCVGLPIALVTRRYSRN